MYSISYIFIIYLDTIQLRISLMPCDCYFLITCLDIFSAVHCIYLFTVLLIKDDTKSLLVSGPYVCKVMWGFCRRYERRTYGAWVRGKRPWRVLSYQEDENQLQASSTPHHEILLRHQPQSWCKGLEAAQPEDGSAQASSTGKTFYD